MVLRNSLMVQLDVVEVVANVLVQEGFSSIEEIAYVPVQELISVEEFDEDIVAELRRRARDVLLTRAIAQEETAAEPAEDLLELKGMDRPLAYRLAERGVLTREDLAEQSVDVLLGLEGMDEQRAGQLIMTAREPWFASEQQG